MQYVDIVDIILIISSKEAPLFYDGTSSTGTRNFILRQYNSRRESQKESPLRRINEIIDFEFIYKEVKDKYGSKGNVSVPPPVILKLMLLLVFYNVRSERELMETVPERIDWLWFLGYNFDSEIIDQRPGGR